MRIVHVSDCYAPRLGGIEAQVAELARVQRAAGHDVRVITATPGHDGVRLGTDVVDGVPVYRVTARMPFELPVHPRAAAHVRRILDVVRPDVVHAHGGVVSPFAYPGARAARAGGVPTVLTIHSMWGPATPVFGAIDRVAHFTEWGLQPSAVSGAAAASLQQVFGPDAPVAVVPNGIDPGRWAPLPRPWADPQRVHLVATMRLAPRKRPVPLLEIWRSARARSGAVDLRLTVAGDGPARASMERYILRHGLGEWVTLAGRVNRDELRALYARADLFIAPATRESFGLAGLEARTSGLPVLAFAATGATEYVRDGREGLLADDDPGMVDALVRITHDADLRAAITAHNRATLPTTTWDAVLHRVLEVYERARRLTA